MKKIHYLFLVFILLFITNCSPKVYDEVIEIKNKNNISNPKKPIIIRNKNFSPLKKILKILEGELTNNNIIIFSWVNHLPKTGVNDYYCLIFNYDNRKIFYLKNTKEKVNDIIFCESDKEFKSHYYLLKSYLSKGKTDLESLEPSTSSESGTSYNLLDTKNNLGLRINGFYIDDKELYK